MITQSESSRSIWRCLRMPKWTILFALLCSLAASPSRGADSSSSMLDIFTMKIAGVTHFFVQNFEASDVTATFEMNLVNLRCSTNLPYTTTFPGNQIVEAFTVCAVEKDAPWSCNYTNSFTIGSVTAMHDETCVYSLPYAVGQEFRVSQGYHGAFSHTGQDEYSVDWEMPLGTHVHAARDGVVVQSKDDSKVGGRKRKFENCANKILIRHSDGTIGVYAHLLKGGNRAKVGDKINAGDWIADPAIPGSRAGRTCTSPYSRPKMGKSAKVFR